MSPMYEVRALLLQTWPFNLRVQVLMHTPTTQTLIEMQISHLRAAAWEAAFAG
jgi:hypothetical protein